MDAYVINLKSSKDRWERIQKSFKDTGILLHRVEPENPRKYRKTIKKRDIGWQSLFLTFLKLVKMAKEKDLPEILILEDDCKPFPRFLELWPKVKAWLDSNLEKWDLYSGGSILIRDIADKKPKLIGSSGSIKFFDPTVTCGTHFIYIHSGAYNSFIKLYETRFKENDLEETDIVANKLKFIISYPFIAYQENGKSTIHGKFRSMEYYVRKNQRLLGKHVTRKLKR
jgi:hypothetical protein